MTRDEAEKEVVRRFHQLPLHVRQDFGRADALADELAEDIVFESALGHRRMIAAWLILEIARTREASAAA